jgi:tetratricopeptide (TPR) repeat protein
LGLHAEAASAFERAIDLKSADSWAWFNLGLVYQDMRHFPEAIQAFRNVVRLSPAHAEAWFRLGLAYLAQGNVELVNEIAWPPIDAA